MFTHILVCCDGSEPSLRAAQAAADLTRRYQSRVTLLYVLDPRVMNSPMIQAWEGTLDPNPVAYYSQEARTTIEQPAGKYFTEAEVPYEWRCEVGHPVQTIVSVAKEVHADLIVMSSRGLGGFERLLLGSVSDGVLHHAHCPVMIVR